MHTNSAVLLQQFVNLPRASAPSYCLLPQPLHLALLYPILEYLYARFKFFLPRALSLPSMASHTSCILRVLLLLPPHPYLLPFPYLMPIHPSGVFTPDVITPTGAFTTAATMTGTTTSAITPAKKTELGLMELRGRGLRGMRGVGWKFLVIM